MVACSHRQTAEKKKINSTAFLDSDAVCAVMIVMMGVVCSPMSFRNSVRDLFLAPFLCIKTKAFHIIEGDNCLPFWLTS